MKKVYSAEERFEALKLANEIGTRLQPIDWELKSIHCTPGFAKQKKERPDFVKSPGIFPQQI